MDLIRLDTAQVDDLAAQAERLAHELSGVRSAAALAQAADAVPGGRLARAAGEAARVFPDGLPGLVEVLSGWAAGARGAAGGLVAVDAGLAAGR